MKLQCIYLKRNRIEPGLWNMSMLGYEYELCVNYSISKSFEFEQLDLLNVMIYIVAFYIVTIYVIDN